MSLAPGHKNTRTAKQRANKGQTGQTKDLFRRLVVERKGTAKQNGTPSSGPKPTRHGGQEWKLFPISLQRKHSFGGGSLSKAEAAGLPGQQARSFLWSVTVNGSVSTNVATGGSGRFRPGGWCPPDPGLPHPGLTFFWALAAVCCFVTPCNMRQACSNSLKANACSFKLTPHDVQPLYSI